MNGKLAGWMVAMLISAVGVQAADIMVLWKTNGVLVAEGMEPGSTGVVEAVSSLGETFTNAAAFFDVEYVVDSNGMIQVAVPMFFRVKGMPAGEEPLIPEGMVEIPAGTNSGTNPLGSGESYDSHYAETYSLTVDAFYMDATEVTKAEWDVVADWAGDHGYDITPSGGAGKASHHPVQAVSWYECVKWCNARSEMSSKTPCYTVSGSTYKSGESTPDCDLDAGGYRLPTSDEWEYAARGGLNSKRFPWGDTINHDNANYGANGSAYSYDTSPYTSYTYHPDYDSDGYPYTSAAADFAANGYGLYDMAGNVSEWCSDWYPGTSSRVLRGGSWYGYAGLARCGEMDGDSPDDSYNDFGFRAVLPAN